MQSVFAAAPAVSKHMVYASLSFWLLSASHSRRLTHIDTRQMSRKMSLVHLHTILSLSFITTHLVIVLFLKSLSSVFYIIWSLLFKLLIFTGVIFCG